MTQVFDDLSKFIETRMRMSHVNQLVMLMTLLSNNGKCSERDIAKELLIHDESQIEYYTKIANNMVGRDLRNHSYVTRDKVSKEYALVDYDRFDAEEAKHLIHLCQERLDAFLDTRGKTIFDHRKRSKGYISGTVKYEVLKRAMFRCELCGISADQKALEVDHIIPRNHGGSDDLSNFQALCYSCNAMKRDRDDTDFRLVRDSYKNREDGCLFCEISRNRIVEENELAYYSFDDYPVTQHHALVIPKRHEPSYFQLGQSEINACTQLIQRAREHIESKDNSVSGFNIGINDGKDAGQSIFHCHIHVLPRRKGDVENPRGGVRHIIPGKGYY